MIIVHAPCVRVRCTKCVNVCSYTINRLYGRVSVDECTTCKFHSTGACVLSNAVQVLYVSHLRAR